MGKEIISIQNFIDSSGAVIYIKDERGRFLMVNHKLAELFRSTKKQILGRTDYDFVTTQQADKWRANDRKVAETGTPMNFKVGVSLTDGQITTVDHKFPVSIEGSPNAVGGIAINFRKLSR